MKSLIMVCGLAAASAMLLHAQSSQPLKADIPFGFYVGDRHLAPGEYEVSKKAEGVIFVRASAGETGIFRIVVPGGGKTAERNELVFRRYGNDRYFLGEIRHEGLRTASWVPQSKLEKEAVTSTLVTAVKPVEVVILARAR